MTDFLLELRSEEIPARMQAAARENLAKLFAGELAKAGLVAAETITYATPRRLTLILRGLPVATEAVSEEVKGPRASAPPQALEGFLRKTGLTADQLTERDGVLFAITEKPGRATAEVLAEAIPAVIRAFPWPKSMRWGAESLSTESLRWVRPLHGIVALFGDGVVRCGIAGIESGAVTLGHRFHQPGAITIGSAGDYVEKLRAAHVIVDQDERMAIIRDGAKAAAAGAGLSLIEDEGLVAENAGLTEWPVPLLGRFDTAFLDVPPEVIQLTARVNQKYFVCRDGEGKLANAFVCTANIAASDGGARIVEGNRKVLAARLADARFFYDTDLGVKLDDLRPKLEKIVFHEKLGTVADKVDRVAKLARWLVEEGVVGGGGSSHSSATMTVTPAKAGVHTPGVSDVAAPAADMDSRLRGNDGDRAKLADMAERAARLAKADLVTGMVGEFPELQGLMGGYYAAAQGEPREVWEAVRDHYKPVGQGDEVPTAPVTVAVSLADKLDTVLSFFGIGLFPSGSRDPFALRRAVLGVLSLLIEGAFRLKLNDVFHYFIEFQLEDQRIAKRFVLGEILGNDGDDLQNYIFPISKISEMSEFDEEFNRIIIAHEGDGQILPSTDFEEGWYHPENYKPYEVKQMPDYRRIERKLPDFFADRLKVQQREAGVRHDLIDAVFALGGEDDLVRLLARVHALQAFVTTEDGVNLLAGYKRAANILKKEGGAPEGAAAGATAMEPAEAALLAALDQAEPRAAAAIDAEDFEGAMAALASLRVPIDRFFDDVTVNDADPAKRAARLALLARVRDAVHAVADFSRIEG